MKEHAEEGRESFGEVWRGPSFSLSALNLGERRCRTKAGSRPIEWATHQLAPTVAPCRRAALCKWEVGVS